MFHHHPKLCMYISDQCVYFNDSNTSTLKTMTVVYFLYCLDRFYEEEACFMSQLSSGLTWEYTWGVVCTRKNTHSSYDAASTWATTLSRKTWLFMKMGQQNWRRWWWYMVVVPKCASLKCSRSGHHAVALVVIIFNIIREMKILDER